LSRVIAVLACGLTVAACSAIPSLDFLKSSPPTAALRFESEPPGAEVKASGQTCHTPCELTVQVTPELPATFALKGYQPETISVRSETSGVFSAPRFAPNPVHADLRPIPPAASAKKRIKRKTPVAASHENSPGPASSAPEATVPANNTASPPPPDVK
jgi:hypothetical protein